MKRVKRKHKINVRFSDEELQTFSEGFINSRSNGNRAEYIRDILLGKIENPLTQKNMTHFSLSVDDHGPLQAGYESMVHYHSMVIAGHYLMMIHDDKFKKVIKGNRDLFDRITSEVRGYDFDDKMAMKLPYTQKK